MLQHLITVLLFLLRSVDSCIPTQQIDDDITPTTSPTTTSPSPTCPSGWTSFDRGTYTWCMEIYLIPLTSFTAAQSACKSLNSAAVPSGFQDLNEVYTMMGIAATGGSNVQLFIGAIRTLACIGQYLTTTCNQLTSFEWTDDHTTGTAGFHWFPDYPDNEDLDENWAIINTSSEDMDDVGAGLRGGVVCGMKAV